MTKAKSRVQSQESRAQSLKRMAVRWALPLLLATQAWAGTTTVYFPMTSFTGTAQNRRVFVTPSVNPITDGTNIIAGMPVTLQPTNGFATNNFVPSVYWITVEGVQTPISMTVTSAAVQLNAVWLCTNLQQFVYAPAGPGVQVAAGTNAIGYTNGGTIVIAGAVGFPAVTGAVYSVLSVNPSNWANLATATNIGAYEASVNQQGNVLTNVGGLTVSNSLPNRVSFNLNNMLNIFDYQAGHFLFSGYPILLDHGISSPGAGLNSEYYGQSASAAGGSGTAVGYGATASATDATAIGSGATASANNGTALGLSSSAGGIDSTAVGVLANAGNTHSTALGKFATTDAANQIMLGTTNDTVVAPSNMTVRGVATINSAANVGGNLTVTGALAAASFSGVGSGITNLPPSGIASNTNSSQAGSAPRTARWDTNSFTLYGAGDTNVGNGYAGTVWTTAFNPTVPTYTNGLTAYSNYYNVNSNAWEIESNGTKLYQGALNVSGIYGDQIASFNYSKAKGHVGALPAPAGFIAAGSPYTGNAPPLWNQTTNQPTPLSYFSNPLAAPGLQADYWLNVGSNNIVQIDTNMPGFRAGSIVGGYDNLQAGPAGFIAASRACTNFDANGVILGSSGCIIYRGSGDDGMIGCEQCVQQNFANSVCWTIGAFGVTNYAISTSLVGACEFGLVDGGAGNFARLGGVTFYDNVNVGMASGSFQTNGTPGTTATPAIWDFGNGNTITTPDTIFLGWTNAGLSIGINAITATAGSSFAGNGSTLTNICSTVATNHISGQLYTNTGCSVWLVGASILLTNTASLGNVEMDLRITGANGITNPASLLIGVGLTNRVQLTGPVAPGQTWTFTNTGNANPTIVAGSGWIQKTGN